MEYINYSLLETKKEQLHKEWHEAKPFHYIVFEDFFTPEAAALLLKNYPTIEGEGWDNTTYINQRNKFTMTKFANPAIGQAFEEFNSAKLLKIIEYITGISDLVADEKLFGGGLHQSIKGAFLDVHVDFNYHPETKYHRRMNILVYLNQDWKQEYNGFLELWDMETKTQLAYVAPNFNRCVIFETNEISFHGHPKPLQTPEGISRKSLAAYYYTKERPNTEIAQDHNTIYVNTEGTGGLLKNLKSGAKALIERVKDKLD